MDTHIRFSEQEERAISEVRKIMLRKGFPEPNKSDAIRYALLYCIANNGKKSTTKSQEDSHV